MTMTRLSLKQIHDLSYDALRQCGASELQAGVVAQELMDAAMRCAPSTRPKGWMSLRRYWIKSQHFASHRHLLIGVKQ